MGERAVKRENFLQCDEKILVPERSRARKNVKIAAFISDDSQDSPGSYLKLWMIENNLKSYELLLED